MIPLALAQVVGGLFCLLLAFIFTTGFVQYLKEMYDPAMIREPHDYGILLFLAVCVISLVLSAMTLFGILRGY